MNEGNVKRYAQEAEKRERDPYGPDGRGRAIVPNGRGFKGWQRFHQGIEPVWVADIDGRMVWLTPTQVSVYLFLRDRIGQSVIMRQAAVTLRVSPSTVSRAMVKLQAFGLITYLTGRGRSARTFILEAVKGDMMTRLRKAAKAKIWKWSEASRKRTARLQAIVALYLHEERGRDSLTDYLYSLPVVESATISAWTPDELRSVGI